MSEPTISGMTKSAVLLIALGTECSAAILKELEEEEMEPLVREVFTLRQVPAAVRRAVILEGHQLGLAGRYLQAGGHGYAEGMLAKALGGDRAAELIDRAVRGGRTQQFDFLRDTDAFQLASVIQDEAPQTIALILAHIPAARAAEILTKLPTGIQSEVAMRIATMERTPPEVVEGVETVLRKRLSGVAASDSHAAGGVGYLVKILTAADRATERTILEYLDAHSPELAAEVRNKMFMFEHLIQLDDASLQRLLRDVDGKDLAIALRGASELLRDAIFRNLSTRAAETLREEIETGRPVRPQQVNEAQRRIVAVARKLDESGEIIIQRGSDHALV